MHVNILQTGLYCHQIILNIENMPFTKLNEKNYILLKVLANSEQVSKKIDLDDIIYFSKSYVFQKIIIWQKELDRFMECKDRLY